MELRKSTLILILLSGILFALVAMYEHNRACVAYANLVKDDLKFYIASVYFSEFERLDLLLETSKYRGIFSPEWLEFENGILRMQACSVLIEENLGLPVNSLGRIDMHKAQKIGISKKKGKIEVFPV